MLNPPKSQTDASPLLDYPRPYRAWLAIASDPDNTVEKDWRELHEFIREELGLPVGSGLFAVSYNEHLPGQVNLRDHPYIAKLQVHDTLHTWGDFLFSRSKRFSRQDAIDAVTSLQNHRVRPRVWIDHSNFSGNLLHHKGRGGVPAVTDLSGHQYPNFDYTLDLIEKIGIRYIWDGRVETEWGGGELVPPIARISRRQKTLCLPQIRHVGGCRHRRRGERVVAR